MKSKYQLVELSAAQKEEMFRAAHNTLVICIKCDNPEDMKDRFLTSVFAFHMMKAEGRVLIYSTTAPYNRWIENNQDRLNQAHAEFKAWLRVQIALAEPDNVLVVDRSIEYLDPEAN